MTATMFSGLPAALLAAALAASPASAQGLRPGDRIMEPAELDALLGGQAVEFFDGSVARYAPDGAYSYTYQPGDPPFLGRYGAAPDSQVCVTFDNGFDRCDTYVMAGDRLVLIIADGTRFPVRRISPLE